jgi:hypothetical protein
MEINFYDILKKLSKDYPNDSEFGSKVRRVLLELDGEVESDILTIVAGKLEVESEDIKVKPTEEELNKLESFLKNVKHTS